MSYFVKVSRVIGIIVGLLWAQGDALRGWQSMEVGPLVVWYVPGQEGLAQAVGQWGADVYRELVGLMEFQPSSRLVIRVQPSPYWWAQAPLAASKGMLLPPAVVAQVYPLASRSATAALVRSEVTALLLQQLYFSEGVRVQNRSLLYLPDWFFWGFAYFWGEGWMSEDLARLEDVPPASLMEIARRTATPSPLYKSLYKSIWFYLYKTYGQRKVIDLIYMARLTRSVGDALYLTMNLSEEDLYQQWMNFLKTLRKDESPSTEEEVEKRALLTAAVAADGETRAFATLREGKVQYFLRLSETLYELPGRWQWRRSYYDPEVSMSFSPKGALVWTAYEANGLVIWRWMPEEKKYERYPLALLAVQGLSWDGDNTLLFSGLSADGKVKVYTLTFPQGTLRPAEEAQGDLLYPHRTPDGLYAVWQPDTTRLAPLGVLWEPFRPVRRQGAQWEPLPYPMFYSVRGGWVVQDTLVATVSDVTGSGHPWVFGRDTSAPTIWTAGAPQAWSGLSQDKVFFLRYRGGKLRLAQADRSVLSREANVFPPVRAAEVVQFRLQRKAAYMAAYRMSAFSPVETPKDTARPDTSRSQRQPFYLFDEEVSRPARRKSRLKPPADTVAARRQSLPTARQMGPVPYHWVLGELRLQPVLHPLMRFGWEVNASARDWRGAHAWGFLWRPYIDLRSSELQISYISHRLRLRPMAELYKQSHYFPARRYNHTLRITTWRGRAGVEYTVAPYLTLRGYGVLLFADRYHIGRIGELNLSGRERLYGAGSTLVYERLTDREGFVWSGWRMALRTEAFRGQGRWVYPLAHAQVERFQPLLDKVVFQIRGIAASGGANGRYFLLGGIPEWINYDFQNRAQVPLLSSPGGYSLIEYATLPGFPYQARRGRNLLLGSVVARLPLLAWRREAYLPTRPVYNFDWHIGYYIGTTWTTGNPFSQKNPIDAEFIFRPPLVISVQTLKSPFLMSFGTGITFQIMKLPLCADVYWPIEEGRLSKATFIAGIRREW